MTVETKEFFNEVSRINYKGEQWPDGEWNTEPDRKQWEDKETGYPCLIVRNDSGNLCGYVGVTKDHPYYEQSYSYEWDIDVHGGLTFSDHCHGRICHVVTGEEDKVWWLGFDCAHHGDYYPGLTFRSFHSMEESYKNIQYVETECKRLAFQLKEIKNASK